MIAPVSRSEQTPVGWAEARVTLGVNLTELSRPLLTDTNTALDGGYAGNISSSKTSG